MSDFMVALGELAHAEERKNPGAKPYYVYVERSGGNANQVVVVIGHPTFADFARTGKSPFQALVEQYGPGSTSIWRLALGAVSSE